MDVPDDVERTVDDAGRVECSNCGFSFRPILTRGRCPECRTTVVLDEERGRLEVLWSRLIATPQGTLGVLVFMTLFQMVLLFLVVRL